MENIERFKLITSPEGTVVITDGQLLLYDTLTEDQVIIKATPEVLNAYGLSVPVDNDVVDQSAHSTRATDECKEECSIGWKGNDNAVLHLIHLWHSKESRFKSTSIRNDDVWKTIAADMAAANSKWKFSWQQCKDKIKYTRKEYVKVKDNNSRSGNPPKTCHFFTAMDEILGSKPCVQPLSVASSSQKRSLPSDSIVEESLSSSEDERKPKKKKKTKVEKEMESWLQKLQADAKAREEARKRRFERGLKVYEETMKKLIDKL